jgi:HEPN domain-containing protein
VIDINKQIAFWRRGAEEDLPVGIRLVREGSIRHGLFFVHLAFEKILKAHVCRHTGDLAPRTHNLARLLELSGISCSKNDVPFIVDMNRYNVEGRYPDSFEELPGPRECETILTESERIFTWFRGQF